MPNNIGFLPCFSCYRHKCYPIGDFYQTPSYITKVKNLLSALVDSVSPRELKQQIGQIIKPVRPNSKEEKRIISLCSTTDQLYRIDYGNNPFRIVFSLSNRERLAYIHIIDVTHNTMSGKNR